MKSSSQGDDPVQIDDDEPLIRRRGAHHEASFDITAMIDLVFMLNIFFLVTTVAAAQLEMDLPVVRHCQATDPADAISISLVFNNPQSVSVSIDGGEVLNDPEDQARMVHQAVEDALRSGKSIILLKAERGVKLKDVKRIGAAATRNIPGMELRMAVIEKE